MSQRERTGEGEEPHPAGARQGTKKTWTNPLDAGPSTLPSRPVDPSPSRSKRSPSPDRSERSGKRRSPGREEHGRRLEGYNESKRRSRSPEDRYGNRCPSKRPSGYEEENSNVRHQSRRLSSGRADSNVRGQGGYQDHREERNDAGYHERSFSSTQRSRHNERRHDEWTPPAWYADSSTSQYRDPRMDSYRPTESRGGNPYNRYYDSRGRDRDLDQSRDDHRDHPSQTSQSSRERHSSRSHRRHTPTRSRSPARPEAEPEAEEGEIEEESEPWPDPNRDILPETHIPLRIGMQTEDLAQPSETGSLSGSASAHRPIKIKNRPTKRGSDINVLADTATTSSTGPDSGRNTAQSHHTDRETLPPPPPPPPPADDRPATPPPAGISTPPPPPDEPPTPPPEPSRITPKSTHTSKSNPLSPSFSASSSQPNRVPSVPSNRALDLTKSQAKYDEHGDRSDGKASVPHAPNRNLLNPTTRPTTPAAKFDTPGGREVASTKLFLRPNAEDEMRDLHKSFQGTATLAAYDLGDKLGEGTFGVVTKGIEISTKRAIALKKLITHNPRDGVSVTTVREIKILKSLDHPNIVEIIDMVVERKNHADRTQRGDVFMVFPYMDHDMCGLLSNSDFKLSHSVAKLLMRQILEGMDYIHANNYVHRDIKTANILVDREGGIKIADFGLARTWTFDKTMPKHLATEYTNMVVTRWYRAPELLLGDRHYGPAVDMWSLGCVLGEMYHRIPILQGETDRDQLFKIFGKLGRPSEETFPGWNKLPGFPDSPAYPWDKVPEDQPLLQSARKWGMDRGGAHLMMGLLSLDPVRRLTAFDALEHDWFWIAPKQATKSKNLITVESSHEMTQRVRNDPVPAGRPKQHRPPPQQRPPQQAWNIPPPQQRHPMNGNGNLGGPPNPYGGGGMASNNMNPYGQQRPRPPPYNNGPPMAAFGNGHGPPNMGMGGGGGGMGMGMNGSYGGGPFQGGGGGGGMGRPPPGQFQGGGPGMGGIPPRPPHAGGAGPRSYSARPDFNSPGPGPGGGGAGNRRGVPPPSGFTLSGGGGGSGNNGLPRRPPTLDIGRRGGGALPY